MEMIEKPSFRIKLTYLFLALFSFIPMVFFLFTVDEIEAKILFSIGFAGLSLFSLVMLYSLHKTKLKINDNGVEVKKLFEHISIKWDEIAQCKMTGFGQVIVSAKNGTILRIRKSDYQNFNGIVERINEKSEVKYEWYGTYDQTFHLILSILLFAGSLVLFVFNWSKQVILGWSLGITSGIIMSVFMSWYGKRKLHYKSRWYASLFILLIIIISVAVVGIVSMVNRNELHGEWELDFMPSFWLGMFFGIWISHYLVSLFYSRKAKKSPTS